MITTIAPTAYQRWPTGMRKTLSLFKKAATPDGDTADPYGTAIIYSACRKREMSRGMMLVYGPMIGLGRSRLFEVWNAEGYAVASQPSNGDVLQEADGTRWTIKQCDGVILDYNFLCICIPEI